MERRSFDNTFIDIGDAIRKIITTSYSNSECLPYPRAIQLAIPRLLPKRIQLQRAGPLKRMGSMSRMHVSDHNFERTGVFKIVEQQLFETASHYGKLEIRSIATKT
jgi:hypothetical protein